ncbi:MAG: beta-ketoacyl-ACP synthase II [Planctomycetaceae bacterium]|nr:beta-ketoacyl-ACP synthase II [Planctomycetota bacterium]NUN52321.1 beta-ketoacyl-ACP synthase II [Planctomycetaceae bacterium]
MDRRRVVVTGIGAVTSLGLDARSTFAGLLEGRSGAAPITRFDPKDHATRFAAEVKGFDPGTVLPPHEARKLDPFVLFAMAAAKEALGDSGLDLAKEDLTRVGAVVGVGIGGLTDIEAQHSVLLERGPRRINPFFIPKIMMNAAAGQISILHGLQGPNYATASACASSAHAVGLAMKAIRWDEADVMLAGGSEATITPLGIGGFNALKALSTRNDDPARASRPFDRDRDGFVMGEGGGCLLLEEYGRARARGARIYAEVKGFGMTADAHHITAPAPGGSGALRSMLLALRDGATDPADVQYVNAHGTSTPINDPLETAAIRGAFGEHAARLAISSSKSMIGHLLGASGAVEAVVCALTIAEGAVHPTANLENPDPECDLDYVPGSARRMEVRNALSNSLGFGGHNATLLLGRVD